MTLEDKIELLRTSIKNLSPISATYDGYPRELCVHIIGTKRGDWKAFAWQFAGSSSRPESLPTWRDLFVGRLIDLTLQDGEWYRGWTTGQRDQKAVDVIDTVVDPAHAAEVRSISMPRTPMPGVRRQDRRR